MLSATVITAFPTSDTGMHPPSYQVVTRPWRCSDCGIESAAEAARRRFVWQALLFALDRCAARRLSACVISSIVMCYVQAAAEARFSLSTDCGVLAGLDCGE